MSEQTTRQHREHERNSKKQNNHSNKSSKRLEDQIVDANLNIFRANDELYSLKTGLSKSKEAHVWQVIHHKQILDDLDSMSVSRFF